MFSSLSATRLACPMMAALLLGIPLTLLPADPAQGQQRVEEQLTDQHVERLWRVHWRELANKYIEHDGQYVAVPDYSPRHDNNRNINIAEYRRENRMEYVDQDDRGRQVNRVIDKPQEEVEAASRRLQDFAVGQYGYLHSGNVVEIRSEGQVLLNHVWLVDADPIRREKEQELAQLRRSAIGGIERAFRQGGRDGFSGQGRQSTLTDSVFSQRDAIDWRYEEREQLIRVQDRNRTNRIILEGFDTSRMTADQRWPSGDQGVHVVIVAVDSRGFGGRQTTYYAVPASRLRRGLGEEQIQAMIESRGHTQRSFAELVVEARREAGRDYLPYIIARLEGTPLPGEEGPARQRPMLDDDLRRGGDGEVRELP